MMSLRLSSLLFLSCIVAAGCSDTGGTASGACSTDTDCSGDTPRCNTATSHCVPCLPENDNCRTGLHCAASGTGFTCTVNCSTASDCSRGGATMSCCGGLCVDTAKDPANCGKCGAACRQVAHTTSSCNAGTCGIDQCEAGFSDCDKRIENGCETATGADLKNCGACGTVCPGGPRGVPACDSGACKFVCSSGYEDCDGNVTNGCETDITGNSGNCGACGHACTGLNNASAVCTQGQCAIGSCRGWFADCDKMADNGCEANVQGDKANCGACGNLCPSVKNGTPGCAEGACTIGACNDGFADCDRTMDDGCEVLVGNDPLNCGACGRICAGTHSKQTCTTGACKIAACDDGFGDCNKNAGDGCESNVSVDPANCGSCGMACGQLSHATTVICQKSNCLAGACEAGWSHCTVNGIDGCETDITTTQNCGKCGVVCNIPNAMPACKAAVCSVGTCNDGFSECDGNQVNGCEAQTSVDINNCGACKKVCTFANATPTCVASACVMGACKQNFGNCNNNSNDGCESSLTIDPANCGKCGNVCPQNAPFCIQGVCASTIHNSVDWQGAQQQGWSCGSYNNLDMFDWIQLGYKAWKDCMREGSKRGAMVMLPMEGDWFDWDNYTPGWFGQRNGNTAMTVYFWGYNAPDINSQQLCLLVRDPQSAKSNHAAPLKSGISYDGQSWTYEDYGSKYYDECQQLAGEAGASIITPWTLGLGNGDDYWEGLGDVCCMYVYSVNNGNDFSTDWSCDRTDTHKCMVGYPNN